MLVVTIEKRHNRSTPLHELWHSVGHWNELGPQIYQWNIAGKLGSKDSQEFARQTPFNVWMLEMIAGDGSVIAKHLSKTLSGIRVGQGFQVGRSGDHVWVHLDGQRVAIITYQA
jgi:hypothetical protein